MNVLIESLTASSIVAGLTASLAVFLYVLDKIVNTYGEVSIDINQGVKILKVSGGSSILQSLSSQGIFLPSACGGRGSCGACKVQVLSEEGPLLPTEIPHLSSQEQSQNFRLGCQVKVKKDIRLSIPEKLFNINEFECIVERIVDLTYDIKHVIMKIQKSETINFKSGQYAQIVIPPFTWKDVINSIGEEKAEEMKKETLAFNNRVKVSSKPGIPDFVLKGEAQNDNRIERAYSMSNSSYDNTHIEMMIRWVPAGVASTYVHTLLKEGQKISCVGPFGDFYLRDTRATMICVAGGSGMAPIKSILYDLYHKGEKEREVWFFFGARTTKDLFLVEELQKLSKQMPNFHFIPALSDAEPQENWQGEKGLITEVLNKYIQDLIKGDVSSFEGYLCGSPGMLDACVKVMQDNKMKKENIFFDKFS